MKKLLLLSLGLSLAAENVNANLLTQEEARNIRKAAATIYVGSTALKAGNVDLGVSANANIQTVQDCSNILYSVIASALEEGDFVVKFANVLEKVNEANLDLNSKIAAWYHADKGDKDKAMKKLKNSSKDAAIVLLTESGVKLGEFFADKLVNDKISPKYARRATRAATYAATYALVTAFSVASQKKLNANDDTLGFFAQIRNSFVDEFVKTLITNLAYEAAGEAAAELLIEKAPAAETIAA